MNDKIVIDPGIHHGQPVIRGTRVPVARILGGLAGGMTVEDITRAYDVTVEDVRAALEYARELIEQESHHPLPRPWGDLVRFLIDADLPRSCEGIILFEQYGHEGIDVRDIGLRGAVDQEIASVAQAEQACLVTGDLGFADVRNYPPEAYSGIVVLELPRNATETLILRLIDEFLQQPEVLSRLSRRLAIVEYGRVRLRPS